MSFPSSGDLCSTGVELASPAWAGRFFTTEPLEKPTQWQWLSNSTFDDLTCFLSFFFFGVCGGMGAFFEIKENNVEYVFAGLPQPFPP